MSTEPDIKKQVEAMLGHEVAEHEVQTIIFIQAVASSTISGGSTTTKNILFKEPNRCRQTLFLDVGGFKTTGNTGESLFRLTDFLCPAGEIFQRPINVVATPISSVPRFVTVVAVLVNNGADVEIKVRSWDANGAAAPNVTFNWRCRVEVLPVISST